MTGEADLTESLCPECLKKLPATIFEDDGRVLISKECHEHGLVQDVYWGDYQMYLRAKRFAHDGNKIINPRVVKDKIDCPSDCGLCNEHLGHTTLANIVVTNRCDLTCWYCFFYAGRMGYVYEPTLEQIRLMGRELRRQRPIPGNAVQLTGGEPCLRDDLVDIIHILKEEGVGHVQLNTNGIRLAQDPMLAQRVRDAGVNTVYLSFDGVSPQTNPKNHWEVPDVLANCRRAGMGVVLVPTVIRGQNDHELGAMVRYASDNIDIVRGLNIQPVSLVGRLTQAERERLRITIPDVIKAIEEQTEGEIGREDFYPVPCTTSLTHFIEAFTKRPRYELSSHFACGMATYLFKDRSRLVPITRFVDIKGLFEYLDEKADQVMDGKSRYITAVEVLMKIGGFIDTSREPKGLGFKRLIFNVLLRHNYETLGSLHHKSLFIGMMHFQDLYNYDIERVKRCTIHYLNPDGSIIPFCAFNVIPEWYRDKIQMQFGLPIQEWEKKNGRRIVDDLYRRPHAMLIKQG